MSDVIQSLLDETFALEHYGVKGQKWGQRNYQNPDGTYTELGKERRRVGYKKSDDTEDETETKLTGKAYKDMTRRERRAAKRKARHNEAERRERREFNRDKASAIENGDLDFVNKHLEKFSNDEIATVVNRYKTMQVIRDLDAADKAKKRKTADHYIDKAVHYLEKAGDVTAAITRIRDKINQSNQTAANAKKANVDLNKARLDYNKALNPDKYKKEKTKDELEKAALDLQIARDNARKAKADADQKEEQARLAKLTSDKNDPDYLEAKEKAKKAKLDAEEAEKKVKDVEKSIKEDKELLKEIERREKEEKKAEKKRLKEEKADKERDDIMAETDAFLDEWRKKKQSNPPAENDDYEDHYTKLADQYYMDSYFSGASKNRSLISKILGSDKLKDYESYKPSKNRTYELEDLNKESRNAIKKIAKEKPTDKFGDYAQDKQWTKDMKKHDSRYIDKWVDDMKKKYMKERNMDAKAAEAKAEEYVDAWIDAYDEGRVLV